MPTARSLGLSICASLLCLLGTPPPVSAQPAQTQSPQTQAPQAQAARGEPPAPPVTIKAAPASPVTIKAGRLLDIRTGTVRSNVFINVENGRIQNVTDSAPPNTKIIDLSNKTVLPGLIDVHVHLLTNWDDQSSTASLRMSAAQGAIWGIHNLGKYVDHGFTTLRDACETDPGYGQFALRDSIARGLIEGPRIFAAGSCVSLTGGHGDDDSLAPDQALPRRPNIADTVDDISHVVRRDLKYGADWIKLMGTGGVMDPFSDFNVQELSEEQMAKAVEIAHRARRHVMVHAEGTEGIKAAVRAGVDSIEHGTMLDEESASLMEKKGTWLVPTLSTFQRGVEIGLSNNQDPVMLAKGQAILRYQQPAFALALKHHLKIAFGDDDDPQFLPREFEALVRGGMTPLDALRAATINGAQLLGIADQAGSLEPGKWADIIAVDGDPAANIGSMEHVVFVMKAGEVLRQQ